MKKCSGFGDEGRAKQEIKLGKFHFNSMQQDVGSTSGEIGELMYRSGGWGDTRKANKGDGIYTLGKHLVSI